MTTVVPDDRQLGAELEEVLPVEGHGHVEAAARVLTPVRREPHAARGLAAADLRAEALGHHRVVALVGRRRDQRLARAHDAVAARAGHADDEVVHRGVHLVPWGARPSMKRSNAPRARSTCSEGPRSLKKYGVPGASTMAASIVQPAWIAGRSRHPAAADEGPGDVHDGDLQAVDRLLGASRARRAVELTGPPLDVRLGRAAGADHGELGAFSHAVRREAHRAGVRQDLPVRGGLPREGRGLHLACAGHAGTRRASRNVAAHGPHARADGRVIRGELLLRRLGPLGEIGDVVGGDGGTLDGGGRRDGGAGRGSAVDDEEGRHGGGEGGGKDERGRESDGHGVDLANAGSVPSVICAR